MKRADDAWIGKLVLLIVAALIMSSAVSAFGVAPSSKDIHYEAGERVDVSIKIMNADGDATRALLYAEGPLADYLSFPQEILSFEEGETEKIIMYSIDVPASIGSQGEIETEVVIRQIPTEGQDTTLSASVAVAHLVKLHVPYDDQYAEIRLFTSNYKKGEKSYFTAEVTNYGKEPILGATVVIDILGPFNNKVAQVRSEPFDVVISGQEKISVLWIPEIGGGRYKAVAIVIYGDNTAVTEKEFSIGEPSLTVDSISSSNFKLGGIAKLDILVSSDWNLPIEGFFADVVVRDEVGNKLSDFKTAQEDLEPFGKQLLEGFWDTSRAMVGKHTMDVALHFLDQIQQHTFDIHVETDRITATPTGQVITEVPGGVSPLTSAILLFSLLVVVLIVINIFVWRAVRKRIPKK
ncbi:MAG: hypothetical protein ABIC95_06095 [archaeon]